MKYLLILMAAVLYGLGGALIRPVSGTPLELGEISSLAVGGARSLIALVFTLSIIIPLDCLLKRQKLRYPPIRLSSKWVWSSAISRGINTLAFATAVVFSSISTAYLLCNMTIVGMLVWQKIVDKKSPDSWQIWTALVVIASCGAYFAVDPHHLTLVGFIAGVIGFFSFSGFFFFNSKIAQMEGPQFITGAVMLSHIIAPVSRYPWNWSLLWFSRFFYSWESELGKTLVATDLAQQFRSCFDTPAWSVSRRPC
jgi:drug/metabolite transporter (DMT)-like permease